MTAHNHSLSLATHDVTARKAHQWTMVAMVAVGFVVGDPWGAVPLALAGTIMLLGRFWWPADLVRQFVWRVAEPAGLIKRREQQEDHATRRVARLLGGIVWLVTACLVIVGLANLGWVLAAAITLMVTLDASVDFCALCFVVFRLDRLGRQLP